MENAASVSLIIYRRADFLLVFSARKPKRDTTAVLKPCKKTENKANTKKYGKTTLETRNDDLSFAGGNGQLR